MGKFYVTSGDLESVIMSETPRQAAEDALCEEMTADNPPDGLSGIIRVSERGLHHIYPDDIFFSTDDIIESSGLSDIFEEIEDEEDDVSLWEIN